MFKIFKTHRDRRGTGSSTDLLTNEQIKERKKENGNWQKVQSLNSNFKF